MKVLLYILYWIGQCTWGCIMTSIGLITVGILWILGYKPHTFGPNIYVCVPGDWGGYNLGPIFIRGGQENGTPETDEYYAKDVPMHEAGHGLQNLIFGPLFPLLIAIPSPWRCVLRKLGDPKKMRDITVLVSSIAFCIGLFAAAAGMGFSILGLIIGGLAFAAYACAFCIGFVMHEIPKYENNKWPDYDEIWFEGQATEWGTKTYKHLFDK